MNQTNYTPLPEGKNASFLLAVDPQKDFCDDPDSALPVPGGRAALTRLAVFLTRAAGSLRKVIVTMDTHPAVAIERTTFWEGRGGEAMAPYTRVTAQAVIAGEWRPRNPAMLPHVKEYLSMLGEMLVWPPHCVEGTPGHAMTPEFRAALTAWEIAHQTQALIVSKGRNPLTEHFSGRRAAVPLVDDPHTQESPELMGALFPSQEPAPRMVFVGGLASSHCVAQTVLDLYEGRSMSNVVVLEDAMAPVPGAESDELAFFNEVCRRGGRVMTVAQAAEMANLDIC